MATIAQALQVIRSEKQACLITVNMVPNVQSGPQSER